MSSMNPAVPQKQWHGLAALAQQEIHGGNKTSNKVCGGSHCRHCSPEKHLRVLFTKLRTPVVHCKTKLRVLTCLSIVPYLSQSQGRLQPGRLR